MSQNLWSTSEINMLKDQKIGYYSTSDISIADYNFNHTINSLTDIYSAGNDFIVDRKYISLDEEILLEDGNFIETESYPNIVGSEGSVAKYNTEWRLFEEDYQFYTINSVSSNNLTLNQFINWEINNARGGQLQSFSLKNVSTMNRT